MSSVRLTGARTGSGCERRVVSAHLRQRQLRATTRLVGCQALQGKQVVDDEGQISARFLQLVQEHRPLVVAAAREELDKAE